MLLTSELNGARARVAACHGIKLAPLAIPAYEGGLHGGRDRDPLWSQLFEQAWYEVCTEKLGKPLLSLMELASRGFRPPALLLILAEDRANFEMAAEEAEASARMRRAIRGAQ
jgi:hypothetical protein